MPLADRNDELDDLLSVLPISVLISLYRVLNHLLLAAQHLGQGGGAQGA